MNLNSLQTRITLSIIGIVAISLVLTIIFFSTKAKKDLSNAMDENAINLLNATLNQVESQYNSIQYYKESMLLRRKIELKDNTDIAIKIIESFYNDYKNNKLSEANAKQGAKDKIEHIRFADQVGYFWINDNTRPVPQILVHPIHPEIVGKSPVGQKYNGLIGGDGNIFTAFLDIAENEGQGYIKYLWSKPSPSGSTTNQPKISFVKYFKPWNWVIGTGVYIDDIDIDVNKRTDAVVRELNKTIPKQLIGENGYFFIFDSNNKMLAHPLYAGIDANILINPVTKNKILEELKDAYLTKTHTLKYLWDKPEHKGEFIYSKKSYVAYFEPLGWYIASSVYEDDYASKITKTLQDFSLSLSLLLIAALFVAILVSRSISKPLSTLIQSITNTDSYGIPINKIKGTGVTEIKTLSTTINKMIATISESHQQLEDSEKFNKVLFQDSMLPQLVLEPITGKCLDCNQATVDIFGFNSFADAIGESLLVVSAKFQENGELSANEIEKHLSAIETRESVFFEWNYQRPDGKQWAAEVHLTKLIYKNKTLLQVSLLDITARKKAQEELSHSRKMDAIGQLAGGVAHDFNNLLGGIITSAQLLKLPKRNLDKKGAEFVEVILNASMRAADLTSKLLTFGRKGKAVSTHINIHSVILDTVAILNNTIDKKIIITIDNKANFHTVVGDHTEIQNVLLNLGINASQAMPEGGELTFTTLNVTLTPEFCDTCTYAVIPGEFIDIEVRDTGSGIELAHLNKIFEPFYTTKQHGSGTGLGLSTVYGTIHSHHGAISVASEIGTGTVFHIYLPCTASNKDMKLELQNGNETKNLTGSGTILLVDDEEIIRTTGSYLLKELGYDVILAENGQEAVEIYTNQHHDIDLIITDMIMPIMNGSEAFYKFKKIDQNCKVIISSGFVRNENMDKMKQDGLKGFIKKPFKNIDLSSLIATTMNNDI